MELLIGPTSLNSYRPPRSQNVLQAWCIPSENGAFMDLPELPTADKETLKKIDSWNTALAAFDANLRIVAGADTVIQLSDATSVA